MCGRYATTRSEIDLSLFFEAADETGGLTADYNVAPTDPVPIVRATSAPGGRALIVARWGLLPHWARSPREGARMINARAETVATSRAFAPSFGHRRCLIPADGWYEWLKLDTGGKRAYFMTRRDGTPLAFAGLWSVWSAASPTPSAPDRSDATSRQADARVTTCSILTTAAIGDLGLVHDRMPLVLPPDRWASWLRAPADPERLLAPPPQTYLDALELRPVGPAVGDVRNDGPDLVARIDAPALSNDRPNLLW